MPITSLFSSISGKFSSALILGTLLPVTVFVILFRILVIPLIPNLPSVSLLGTLVTSDETAAVVGLSLAIIVVSGLLYNLNGLHIQFYEGYPWQDTWIGKRRTKHYQTKRDFMAAQKSAKKWLRDELQGQMKEREQELSKSAQLQRALDASPDPLLDRLHKQIDAAATAADNATRDLNTYYPKRSSVLPTALGNAIRSFENYPQWQYDMSAIPLWPRLVGVMDKDYAEAIDNAKSSLDFMLNLATLFMVLALSMLIAGLIFFNTLSTLLAWLQWLGEMIIFAGLSRWLYRQSIELAVAWGDMVKGAFDLYRGKLLIQLGYTWTPKTVDAERTLWQNISRRIIFGDPPQGTAQLPNYSLDKSNDPATGATTQAENRGLIHRITDVLWRVTDKL
jgi:hypothetical protein